MSDPGGAGSKGAGDENFPVASPLIAPALRPHVGAFYDFARAADDIADDPGLGPDQKLARLGVFSDALSGAAQDAPGQDVPGRDAPGGNPAAGFDCGPARALGASLKETGVSPAHARDLLAAFRQDAVKQRYDGWVELMDYCRYSAAPCGRYLLALHGEAGEAVVAAADALSAALQVINHLQDCGADYQNLHRVYIPLDWLEAEGAAMGELAAGATSPALRRVFDRMLVGVEHLLADARSLPALIKNPRLALEAAVVAAIARKLSHRLKTEDPLAGRVALTRVQFAGCAMIGLTRGVWARLRRHP
ncbi:MAG: squalene/phytoene synthase family protein [Alphaproteobacteria bacterium]|nr:squalene/phytoene synthase family protein [Alphaproteobacteria bacterium]